VGGKVGLGGACVCVRGCRARLSEVPGRGEALEGEAERRSEQKRQRAGAEVRSGCRLVLRLFWVPQ